MWYVYMLECGDGTLYTGVTTDVTRRVAQHAHAQGAKYTRARGVSKLRYTEACATRAEACRREAEIKGWTRARKVEFIERSLDR